MPKPLLFPTKVLIGFNDKQMSAVDDWRRQQDDLPTRSEAIRRIIDEHLFGRAARSKSSTVKRKGQK